MSAPAVDVRPAYLGPAIPVDGKTPRRRRAHVCAHLRVDGEPVAVDTVRGWLRGTSILAALLGRLLTCRRRPYVQMTRSWTDDVCTSSWGRTCPYLRAGERAGVA